MPTRTLIAPVNTWGIGQSRPNINMFDRSWQYYNAPTIIQPRPCPPRPCPPVVRPTYPGRDRGVVVGTSGISINAQHRGERWNVGVQVNPGGVWGERCGTGNWNTGWGGGWCSPTWDSCNNPCFISSPNLGWWWPVNNAWWSGNVWNWGASPVTGYYSGVFDPQLLQQPMPMNASGGGPAANAPQPTAFDEAVDAMRMGRHREAVSGLRRFLRDHPDDAEAMRVLAVGLVADKRVDDAASVMRLAYRTDPKLTSDPIPFRALGFSDKAFRELLTRSVHAAHRTQSASAWMLVASLMHAEGRNDTALQMLERAKAAGLDREIYDTLQLELRP